MAEYWVAPSDHASWPGSDANPGTSTSPKLTIAAGVALLSSGDTLWLHDGEWNAEGTPTTGDWYQVPNGDGTWTVTTKIKSVNALGAKLSRPVGDTLASKFVVWLADGANSIEFVDIDFDGNDKSSTLVNLGEAGHHIRFTRCTFQDSGGHGTAHNGASNVQYLSCNWARIGNGGHGVQDYGIYNQNGPTLLQDCTFTDCGTFAITAHSNGLTYSGVTIERCIFLRCGNGYGGTLENSAIIFFNSQHTNSTIRNNIFLDCRRGINISGNSSTHVIYHNTFYTTSGSPTPTQGILIAAGSTGCTVKNNVSRGYATEISDGASSTKSNNVTTGTAADLWVDPTDRTLATVGASFTPLVTAATLVDAGTDVGIAVDFAGALRAQGAAVDIGALEYGADPPDKPINVHMDTFTITTTFGAIELSVTPGTNDVVEIKLTSQGAKVPMFMTLSGASCFDVA